MRGSGSARWPDCLPSSKVAQGVLLIPVSGRVVGVVCEGEEMSEEKVPGTPSVS